MINLKEFKDFVTDCGKHVPTMVNGVAAVEALNRAIAAEAEIERLKSDKVKPVSVGTLDHVGSVFGPAKDQVYRHAWVRIDHWPEGFDNESIRGFPVYIGSAPVDQTEEITELKAALTLIMRAAEGAKVNCGSNPESPDAIRNGALASIAAVAAQGLGLSKGPKLSEGV